MSHKEICLIPTSFSPGSPQATRGKIWPKPALEKEVFGRFSIVDATRFNFQVGQQNINDITDIACVGYEAWNETATLYI
jgi:hypothetical protein